MAEVFNTIDILRKRIHSIIKEKPSHKEVLEFVKAVMIEQEKMKPTLKVIPVKIDEQKRKGLAQGVSLVDRKDLKLDTAWASGLFKSLCKILSTRGAWSGVVARITQALQSREMVLSEVFKDVTAENGHYISAIARRLELEEDLLSFLAESSVKPIFEVYADQLKGDVDHEFWWKGYCPICASPPSIAALRQEGERFLVCSLCSFEWRFMRLKCPFCETEDHQNLRYFSVEGHAKAYRVDVCETCKRYIKTVDTREMAGQMIPAVEDMGTLYLDVRAQEEGYLKGGITHGALIN